MQNPANLDPMKVAAESSVNKGYAGIQKRMESQLAGRGFGTSGKVAMNTQQNEIARASALGKTESDFSAMQLDQENNLVNESMRFGFANPGNSGTGTDPGNIAGGAMSGGMSTLMSLFALQRMLNSGGDNSPGMYGGYSPSNGDFNYNPYNPGGPQ